MLQLKSILVPVDFSERSAAAAGHAAAMAGHFDSELSFVHVIPPLPFAQIGYGRGFMAEAEMFREEDAVTEAHAKINELVKKIGANRQVHKVILQGEPAPAIVNEAKKRAADLILMPTHGYGPFRRFILGSVTAKVLHDVQCPVFTGTHVSEIPAVKTAAYERVACAIDLKEHSEAVLQWAWGFAQAWKAELVVVHAAHSVQEGRDRQAVVHAAHQAVENLVEKTGCKADIRVEASEVIPFVVGMVDLARADILVIGRTPDKETAGRLRTHSYALIRESPCPVVSI